MYPSWGQYTNNLFTGDDLYEVVGEDANAAVEFPLPPAPVLEILSDERDDVTLIEGQLVIVLSDVRIQGAGNLSNCKTKQIIKITLKDAGISKLKKTNEWMQKTKSYCKKFI